MRSGNEEIPRAQTEHNADSQKEKGLARYGQSNVITDIILVRPAGFEPATYGFEVPKRGVKIFTNQPVESGDRSSPVTTNQHLARPDDTKWTQPKARRFLPRFISVDPDLFTLMQKRDYKLCARKCQTRDR